MKAVVLLWHIAALLGDRYCIMFLGTIAVLY